MYNSLILCGLSLLETELANINFNIGLENAVLDFLKFHVEKFYYFFWLLCLENCIFLYVTKCLILQCGNACNEKVCDETNVGKNLCN